VPNVFAFEGFIPVVHESAFIHANATVTGNVVIGRDPEQQASYQTWHETRQAAPADGE